MATGLSRTILNLAHRWPMLFQEALAARRAGLVPRWMSAHWFWDVLEKEFPQTAFRMWLRTVMYRECLILLQDLTPEALDVLEISPGTDSWKQLSTFRSVASVDHPRFDICRDRLDRTFDLVIADQVLEHVLWPYRAVRNIHAMLRDGGHFLCTTPFMIKVHEVPVDCSRWTETGLRYLLAEGGFSLDSVKTGSWGNRACVKGNFKRWPPQRWFRSLRNEPDFPVAVWALARK